MSVAVVGVLATLAGAFVQWLLATITAHRDQQRRDMKEWRWPLLELKHAVGAATRFTRCPSSSDAAALEARLDDALQSVLLLCPIELSRPAVKYARLAYAPLRGGQVDQARADAAEQELTLVFRRMTGADTTPPRPQRGARARRGN